MLSRLDQYERALLGEVVENPRDEVALSIYADWLLDQHEDAARTRGEYIKLELAQTKTLNRDELKDLRWQAHDLWWNHGENWLGPLYEAVDHFVYERGRLVIEISGATFMDRPAEEIESAPAWELVTDIVFRSCSPELLQFLRQLPRPAMLSELDVPAKTIEADEVAELIASGLWDDLTGLGLNVNPLADAGAAILAEWPGLASLRRLNLDSTLIGPEGGAGPGPVAVAGSDRATVPPPEFGGLLRGLRKSGGRFHGTRHGQYVAEASFRTAGPARVK